MTAFPTRGLYAITRTGQSTEKLFDAVTAAIRGGAAVIQYRDKNAISVTDLDAPYVARELVNICHRHDIPLIINDNVELALSSKADGVHLGKDDDDIITTRIRLGSSAILGISCYNNIDRALTAQNQGATYVAFGRFFSSGSKPLATPADISTLREAKQQIRIPIVAIGGILPENGGQLLAAGADLLAVIGGVFDHEPEKSAREYQHLFAD
jgi:thiamine-phosphate pyrophosphorylase